MIIRIIKRYTLILLLFVPFSIGATTVSIDLNVVPSLSFSFGETTTEPSRIEQFVFETGGGSITFTNSPTNAITMFFSSGVLTTSTDFFLLFYNKSVLIPIISEPPGKTSIVDNFYDLRAFEGQIAKTNFGENFSLTFYYTDAQIASFNESSVRVHSWNTVTNVWDIRPNFTIDEDNNTIVILTDHLTLLGIFGDTPPSTPTTPSGGGGIFKELKNIADFNGDKIVDVYDFSIFLFNWGTPTLAAADFNGDGVVNAIDFSIFLFRWT